MNTTKVPGLSAAHTEAAMSGLKDLTDRMRAMGLLQHGALVDVKYVAERSVTTGVQYPGATLFQTLPADLPESLAMLASLSTYYTNHISDGTHAHNAVDSTNVLTTPAGTDQTTGEARANELKSDLNEHLATRSLHGGALPFGSGFKVSKPDASDLSSLRILVVDIAQVMYTHLHSAAPVLQLDPA